MLDALVNEAQMRWGLDLAQGLQVVGRRVAGRDTDRAEPAADRRAVERCGASRTGWRGRDHLAGSVRTPFRERPTRCRRSRSRARRPPRRCAARPAATSAFEPAALPGRHGPRGSPLALLRRLYPADHPVGRFGAAEGDHGRRPSTAARPRRAGCTSRRSRRRLARRRPWALPWISARLRAPDGCPWDREQTHRACASTCSRRRTRCTTRSEAGATPALAGELGDLLLQIVLHAQLAAEAGVFDLADVQRGHRRQDRPPPSARLRRGPGRRRSATSSRNGSHQGGRARRPSDADAAPASGVRACRPPSTGLVALAARAGRAPGDAGARRQPGLRLARPRGHHRQGRARRPASCWRAEPAPSGAEEFGDLLLVLVNLGAPPGRRGGGGAARRQRQVRRRVSRSVERLGRGQRQVALRDLDFDELDELWASPSEGRGATAGHRHREERHRHEHRRGTRPGRRPAARRQLRAVTHDAGRPEVGGGLVPHPHGRHARPVRGHDRGSHPAAPARQGHRLGHRRVQHAAAGDRRADAARGRSRAGSAAGRTRSSASSAGRCAASSTSARLGERTVTVDCDVLQADGGTRTASITGGYVALAAALDHVRHGAPPRRPRSRRSASGIVDGTACLDLDYSEDSHAEVDLNVVGTDAGAYVELQGTAEGKPFDRAAPGRGCSTWPTTGWQTLFEAQRQALVKPAACRPVSAPAGSLVWRPARDHKLRELRELLRICRTPGWCRSTTLGIDATSRSRTGETFETNARLKARFYGRLTRPAHARRRLGPRGRRARRRAGRPDAALRRRARHGRRQQPQAARRAGRTARPSAAAPATSAAWRFLADAAGRVGRRADARGDLRGPHRRRRRGGPAASATTPSSSRPASRPAGGRSGCARPPRRTPISHRAKAARRMAP